jgi:hypothetical protein
MNEGDRHLPHHRSSGRTLLAMMIWPFAFKGQRFELRALLVSRIRSAKATFAASYVIRSLEEGGILWALDVAHCFVFWAYRCGSCFCLLRSGIISKEAREHLIALGGFSSVGPIL